MYLKGEKSTFIFYTKYLYMYTLVCYYIYIYTYLNRYSGSLIIYLKIYSMSLIYRVYLFSQCRWKYFVTFNEFKLTTTHTLVAYTLNQRTMYQLYLTFFCSSSCHCILKHTNACICCTVCSIIIVVWSFLSLSQVYIIIL